MVAVLLALIIGASASFLGAFKGTQQVTLVAPRAGLVMNPDAKVKLRGVEVGRVAEITERGGDAILTLDIADADMAKIPANVAADIKSNTIFGAKAVNFVVPGEPEGTLTAGAEIPADRVVVELNTVYQQLVSVLAQLQPEKLNATLGAINTALQGQGEEIGVALEQLTALLGKTNPHLPALNRLFRKGATVTNVYADSMPDLMRTVDNFTTVGNTLVDNTSNLDALLINATGMANTIDGVIAPTKKTLIGALSDLNPIAALLGYNSPGIKCFLTAGAIASEVAAPFMGGRNGMLMLDAGLLPGRDPYAYPYDLPRVGVEGPPTCDGGLSDPATTVPAPFYVGDNAPQPYQPRTKAKANSQKLFQILFGEPPRG
ncbi:MCE family protein [Gordonia sp. JH63]|uniref:MCE family protein n=1 Tax=Gordonia hongkongensis TaxID=1701090 RepID=A0AAX3TDP5_9ACTN|nr:MULTISPECIES: MCE family protein [Gordonia]MCX2754047.1 MCE family protein [Gordonia sp. 4N]QHD88275.1 MCE family protein [Gordonia sp. JH63]QIK49913.1 MCE family protein [Gordonia terrae]WFP27320.1 MCE family protein [Gordonia hongkongensis]